ncbi:hypothetical protein ACFLTE_06950 [Bacteroidota bacterium]
MKPIRIFLFLFIVLFILLIISLVFPENGIVINELKKIKFPKPEQIFTINKSSYKDITAITAILDSAEINRKNYFEIIYNYNHNFYNIDFDLLKDPITHTKKKTSQKKSSSNSSFIKTHPLEYANNNKTLLYSFFETLKTLKSSNELIRILHYGDSQIEGDRITSYIRNELQKQFGGSGIGMFPVNIISEYVLSIKHDISKNWQRYNVQDIKDGNIDHKRMGIMLSFSRYSPPQLQDKGTIYESWINIKKSDIAYSLAKSFTKCRLFYGFNRKPLVIEIFKNDKLYDAEILLPNNKLQVDEWNFNEPGTELSIRFKGEDSPDIYAISLDHSRGIAVDNIPLRGSKGLDFTQTDMGFLKEMYETLNVKLIILQFGVNLVPLMADDYTFYEEQLYNELVALKKLNPKIPIIVIGISDMSRSKDGRYETFPQIKKIRQAQKTATFKAGCIFWDTYQAMGGENSMPSWVYNNPPLARKDFTHFTYTGSKLISKIFYNSLIRDYNEYISKH